MCHELFNQTFGVQHLICLLDLLLCTKLQQTVLNKTLISLDRNLELKSLDQKNRYCFKASKTSFKLSPRERLYQLTRLPARICYQSPSNNECSIPWDKLEDWFRIWKFWIPFINLYGSGEQIQGGKNNNQVLKIYQHKLYLVSQFSLIFESSVCYYFVLIFTYVLKF